MNVRNFAMAVTATLGVLFFASVTSAANTKSAPPPLPDQPSVREQVPLPQPQYGRACDTEPGCCEAECGDCAEPCGPTWHFFGDFLYLRPRNAGVEFAVVDNLDRSQQNLAIQDGPTATLNPQFQPGFRVGGGIDFDCSSTITATFTHYENTINNSITNNNPNLVIRSLVTHPNTVDTTTANWGDASARQFIKYNFADIDYRHVFYSNECTEINYLIGFRYASLEQQFNSQFEVLGRANVDTNINFDGAGIRLGLEGERHAACRNLFLYGKSAVNFLGGEFQGNYVQTNINVPLAAEAQTSWQEARLVTILECEIGVGWTSCNGHVRATAGYMLNGWVNVVKTAEFISAVQADKYHGPDKIEGNGLVFDGFVSRIELTW